MTKIYCGDDGEIAVVDRRTRLVNPVPGTRMSICAALLRYGMRGPVDPSAKAHACGKLIVPDTLLTRQFADAGLELTNLGGVADLSPCSYSRGENQP